MFWKVFETETIGNLHRCLHELIVSPLAYAWCAYESIWTWCLQSKVFWANICHDRRKGFPLSLKHWVHVAYVVQHASCKKSFIGRDGRDVHFLVHILAVLPNIEKNSESWVRDSMWFKGPAVQEPSRLQAKQKNIGDYWMLVLSLTFVRICSETEMFRGSLRAWMLHCVGTVFGGVWVLRFPW